MKAMRVTQNGDPSIIQLQEIPQPVAGPGEALVRVHAAGVNYADVYYRNGSARRPIPFPLTLGIEGSGTVEAVGDDVKEVKRGDRVAYATMGVGSYAEYQVVRASVLAPLPDDRSFEDGAAVILQGLTAHYLLHEFYPIKRGSTVLVHAAAGGMGLLLVQWLKHMGAVAIGTVSTEEKAQIAREAGADHVILYTKHEFAEEAKKLTGGKGVDYVIDGVGKTTFTKNLDAVRNRGWATVYGMASGPADPLSPNALMTKSITISGGALFNYMVTREELLSRARDLFAAMREGWLKLRVVRVFPLAEAAEAHRLLESRMSTGKLILKTGR
ncbi:MAG TPA: quinone oxidoreductase [Candidatus Acidoferrales bacterium]|jgi:NADPH2:quinone reductase|nr:quinone oxidoreductase [Candidatus Acidoferrales bacterium]